MPFGLKKSKEEDIGDDAARSSLFSKRSKNPAPSTNPYAASSPDPYAQRAPPPAYTSGLPSGPGALRNQQRQEKSPVPPGGYMNDGSRGNSYGSSGGGGGGGDGGGYGAGGGAYGGQGAYGGNRYGDVNGGAAATSRPGRQGGYGGLGPSSSMDQDSQAGRDALFGGAAKRAQAAAAAPAPKQPSDQGGSTWGGGGEEGGYGGGYGGGSNQGYGAYADRQLTAEEEEEGTQFLTPLLQADVKDTTRPGKPHLLTIRGYNRGRPSHQTTNPRPEISRRLLYPQRPPHRRPSRRDRPRHAGPTR
jgi:protein transport protein SEC9